MFDRIDHLGIAVRSIDAHIPLYRDVLGLEFLGEDVVEEQRVRVAFFKLGESKLELIEPLDDDSTIAKYIEKNGEGIHHVALGCEDIVAAREDMESKDVRLLSDKPLDGAHGKLITFMHPKDTGRVLMEMVQQKHEG